MKFEVFKEILEDIESSLRIIRYEISPSPDEWSENLEIYIPIIDKTIEKLCFISKLHPKESEQAMNSEWGTTLSISPNDHIELVNIIDPILRSFEIEDLYSSYGSRVYTAQCNLISHAISSVATWSEIIESKYVERRRFYEPVIPVSVGKKADKGDLPYYFSLYATAKATLISDFKYYHDLVLV